MKLFKNFKTKKQLRAEIERLKAVQWRPPIINVEQREIQKLCASCLVDWQLMDMAESDVSEEYAKKRIAEEFVQHIIPFIEYSVEDCKDGKIYRGVLRVVGKGL